MKRISKILSLLMIATLLFSMAVVPVSAEDADYKFTYEFRDTSDNVITSAEKGDMVRLYIKVNFSGKIDSFVNTFMYDATVFTPYRTNGTTVITGADAKRGMQKLGDFADKTAYEIEDDDMLAEDANNLDAAEYYKWSKTNSSAELYNCQYEEPATWDDAKKAQYNLFRIVYGLSADDNVLFMNTNGEEVAFAYINMKVSENIDLTETVVGYDESLAGMSYVTTVDTSLYFTASAKYEGVSSVLNKNVTAGSATLSFGSVVAAPEVVCVGTMARMDKWEEADSTNVFDGGLMGQINNLELTFTNNKCDQIESIEVFLNGEKEASANAYDVYKVDDTTYKFRAVIKNLDKTNDDYATDFEYKFVVTLKGEYAGQILEVEGKTNAEAIYKTAKANYDAR